MADSKNLKLDYLEIPTKDINATKKFFAEVFGWEFTDYGPEYTSFSDQGLNGGFYTSPAVASSRDGASLAVLYAEDLEQCMQTVEDAGGRIIKDIFEFPGGRRFHFLEPGGNEMAVWSE